MSILGFTFLGVRTEHFADVRAFYRDVLGMPMVKDEPHAVGTAARIGDRSGQAA
ncbi:VOC family protein [Geodermatophilus sp. URMC 62]|uniref:VOC family protein n=1 Tax=Geodermatophilus sp. URMC 62 TaxID=3423414 RepID=UPI00406C260B